MKKSQFLLRPSLAILGILAVTYLASPVYAVDDDDALSEAAKKSLLTGAGPKEPTPVELKKLKESLNGPVNDAPDIHVASSLEWKEETADEKINSPAIWNPIYDKSKAGDADSLYLVGLCFAKGQPLAQDLTRAFKNFFAAAQKDHLEAKFLAARCLDLKVVKLSPKEQESVPFILLSLYEAPAKAGHPLANYYLGCYHESVLKSDGAIKYIVVAAEKGYAPAQYDWAMRILKGEDYRFGSKQIYKLLKTAAEQGYAKAQYQLGCYQAEGLHGIAKNQIDAYAWISAAAANGIPDETRSLLTLKAQLSSTDFQLASQKAAEFTARFKSPAPSKNPLL